MRQRADNLSTQDREIESAIIREAVNAELISNPFDEFEGMISPECSVSEDLVSDAMARFEGSGSENTADLESAGLSPHSLHYGAHSRSLQTHPGTESPFDSWTVELARFVVPRSRVGVVKGFEQFLAQQAILENPAYVYTQGSQWGIPGPWYTGIANPVSGCIWKFRLYNMGRDLESSPAWVSATGNVPLPDIPYSDLPMTRDLWYPAGGVGSNNVHLLVPSNSILRVFLIVPQHTARLEAAAHLKGFIQSDRSDESRLNVRSNW